MPNIFKGTELKKHITQFLNERQMENFSKMIFTTTDGRQKINQFMKNVSLHPINCICENFKQYFSSVDAVDEFIPEDLDSTDQQKRAIVSAIVLNFFKEVGMFGMQN